MFRSIVEAVLHYANIQPNKLCLADDNEKVSYKEYADRILKFASFFSSAGIQNKDFVIVEATQTIDYLAIELGLQLIGAIFVPVEHNCAVDKINSFAERTNAKAVITCEQHEFQTLQRYTYEKLKKLLDGEKLYTVENLPESNVISEILFSTGTTGKEKGIILTHNNDIAIAQNVIYGVEMETDNVEMIPSPLNHSHGLRRYYANMYNGCTVILLGSVMNVKRFFHNLDMYSVNSMDLVPTALAVLLKLSKNKLSEYKDKLRYIQFGAAPMAEADQRKICELLPKTRLYNFYGSTESGCICIYNFNIANDKKHCIGKPAHNAKIVFVDDYKNEITTSEDKTGLLVSYGPMNMLGYWQDPEETQKVLLNGAVYSNDVAYYDEDGDIILLGRKGDVINVGGNKVSPDEIEDIAKKMSKIADCGVVPVEDAYKGAVPKLFVQMATGETFDAVEIRNFLAGHLEPYKIPAYIEQIERIPRSYNGKLLRKELM